MKMTTKWLALALVLTMAAACSDDNGGGSGDPIVVNTDAAQDTGADAADVTEEVALPDATQDPNGPEILEFSVSPERITEGGHVTISVAITDPQGFADIGGGRVLDEQGESYGIFAGSGGTFTATLTWQQINNVAPINFQRGQQRVFIAEFFDSQDNRTTQPFRLELHCDGQAACQGTCGETVCTDECASAGVYCDPGSCVGVEQLNTSRSCGACGNTCDSGSVCDRGRCVCSPDAVVCDDTCVDLMTSSEHCGQCGNTCGDGRMCTDGICKEAVATGYPCVDDSHCPGGYCSTAAGENICIVACSENDRCPGEMVCEYVAGYPACLQPCTSNADCSSGTECQNLRETSGDDRAPDMDACYVVM